MIQEPKCNKRGCVHFIGVLQPDGTEQTERVVCRAYPARIPNVIAYGSNKHIKVRNDQDNEIIFEEENDQ